MLFLYSIKNEYNKRWRVRVFCKRWFVYCVSSFKFYSRVHSFFLIVLERILNDDDRKKYI